ncbi:hypothetical protein AGRA671_19880 [Agrobacterium radiobacter]
MRHFRQRPRRFSQRRAGFSASPSGPSEVQHHVMKVIPNFAQEAPRPDDHGGRLPATVLNSARIFDRQQFLCALDHRHVLDIIGEVDNFEPRKSLFEESRNWAVR